MQRAYYQSSLNNFLNTTKDGALGVLARNDPNDIVLLQRNAWLKQIDMLQNGLQAFSGYESVHIMLEYGIPRMGKRVDTIIFINGVIFVIEFKVGSREYTRNAIDQALGYALDLKSFHEESHKLDIVPILVATRAPEQSNNIRHYDDNVYYPLRCNKSNFIAAIEDVMKQARQDDSVSPKQWMDSPYKPTPTIIEAAQALYANHKVEEISRNDASAQNLQLTAKTIFDIIKKSKEKKEKSICFVTGVPGAGKTLAGLNIANKRFCEENDEHAVFLSGNLPLVQVLQEALARDAVERARERKKHLARDDALREATAFIQPVHRFRDNYLNEQEAAPSEMVAIFDEAQRAWTLKQTQKFMERRRGITDFNQSEPEFLISILDRHEEWAVIVCLVGGGQEIHTGEAGIGEWFSALGQDAIKHWKIYVSEEMDNAEYRHCQSSHITKKKGLHLSVSMRSYRSENVSEFVRRVLENNTNEPAKDIFEKITDYPIFVTRDIAKAKGWINDQFRAAERTGIVASSSGGRLKPYGISVKEKIDPKIWFLNDKADVRSSNFLEDVATEFDIQGLELDWVCVAWDADLSYANGGWEYRNFRGARWNRVKDDTRKNYLLNSYRVLLTRARQGMVIFVPEGDSVDATRLPEFYDSTYRYLQECGIKDIDEIEQ